MSKNSGKHALDDVRIVDLSHVMSGPVCSLLLADMGADVLKIESPPLGDSMRQWTLDKGSSNPSAFRMVNRNKRSIAVNLKTEKGKRILKELIVDADVLLENFSLGVMDRLGLGYDNLKKINPRLIYCQITAFGKTGPSAGRVGFDLIAQAASGIMSITGESPGRSPIKCGVPITDISAGLLAAVGILAAYTHRLKTGCGQLVDTSIYEAGIMQTYWQSAQFLDTGVVPGPLGSAHTLTAPYQAFPTADGWIVVGAANQRKWLAFVGAIDRQDLKDDPRFAEVNDRIRNQPVLEKILNEVFSLASSAEWLERLDAAGVPAGLINSIKDMLEDPQTKAREMVVEVSDSDDDIRKALGCPIKFSETSVSTSKCPEKLGASTLNVLLELGYTSEQINLMVAEGVVGLNGEDV